MIGQRWDLDVTQLLDFAPGWEKRLEAEEIATPPESIPILRLVKDGKRIREVVGNQPKSLVRKFFMEAMGQ